MLEYNYTDELYHHGVKGQKWGVRRYQNADGTLTDAGKKRYAKMWVKNARDIRYDENPADAFRKIGLPGEKFDDIRESMNKSSGGMKSAMDEMKQCVTEAEVLLGDYHKTAVRDRCASIAGIATDILGGYSPDNTMKSISYTIDFYANEDGDQGRINSASVYLREKGLVDKAVKLTKQYEEADRRYTNECESQVNGLLGRYGSTKMHSASWSSTVASSIANHIKNYDERTSKLDPEASMYAVREGCDWIEDTGSGHVNSAVKKATSIVNNIDFSNGNSLYIVRAVDNLNLSHVDVDDMTPEQWSAINREMARLNKR